MTPKVWHHLALTHSHLGGFVGFLERGHTQLDVVRPVNWSGGKMLQPGQTLNSDILIRCYHNNWIENLRPGAVVLPADVSLDMATRGCSAAGATAAAHRRARNTVHQSALVSYCNLIKLIRMLETVSRMCTTVSRLASVFIWHALVYITLSK